MIEENRYPIPDKVGDYVFRGTVGEGAFSLVKLVFNEKTSEFFACKIIPKKRIKSEDLMARFESEIRINQQMHHPGIVQIVDLLQDDLNFYIFMEFCPNGEIFGYIVERNRLEEDEAKKFFVEIAEALRHIHSLNVAHRDLKPENLLLDLNVHVKISDFGLSRFVSSNGMVETPCGSPCYASPECLSGEAYNGKGSDIWSFGVILFAMVTGQLPWTKRNQAQLFAQIRQGQYVIPKYLSRECRDIIAGMLTVDVKKRLTLEQLSNHPWIRGVKKSRVIIPRRVGLKIVSLRKVDDFFNQNISGLNLATLRKRKNRLWISQRNIAYDRLLKIIKPKAESDALSVKIPDNLPIVSRLKVSKNKKRPITVIKKRGSALVKPKIKARRSVVK